MFGVDVAHGQIALAERLPTVKSRGYPILIEFGLAAPSATFARPVLQCPEASRSKNGGPLLQGEGAERPFPFRGVFNERRQIIDATGCRRTRKDSTQFEGRQGQAGRLTSQNHTDYDP